MSITERAPVAGADSNTVAANTVVGRDLPPASIQCFSVAEQLPDDVQRFFASAENQDIEFGLAWYKNLARSVYPDDPAVRIYIMRQHGAPVAAVPVRIVHKSFSRQVESLSNYYTALYAPVVAPSVTARELSVLLAEIRNTHTAVSSFRMAPMDPDAPGFQILMDALRLAKLWPFRFFCFGNWYLPVKTDCASYLRSREGQVRSTLKRMGKKFASEGGKFELIAGGTELERGLAAYEHIYALSWKHPEPYPAFIPGLMRMCAERGWLRLGVAWLHEAPVAAQFWIVANGKASIYKLAYDENFKAFAPGSLLTAMLMEDVMSKDQVNEVDYLIGDDPYKKTWMSHRRERWGIIAYNAKTISGFLGLCREIVGRAIKRYRAPHKP